MCPELAIPVSLAATGLTPRKSYSSHPSRPSSRSAAWTAAMSSDMEIEYSSGRRPYNRRVSPACPASPGRGAFVRRRIMKRALLTGVLAAAAFVAGAAAQTPPVATARVQVEPGTQPVPPVTFRAEIDYVEVDAVVTDERGNLVKGLTQEDFDIYEDGKPQKVSFFSQVVIPVEKLERFMTDGKPLVPDVRSNAQPFSGRIYVLLLDDYHVGALRSAQVKKAAHAFIDRYLGANDVAAVIHSSGRLDAAQEFTSDPRLPNAAIDKFMGQKLRSRTLERLDEYNRTSDLRQPTSSNDGTTGQGVTGADQKILDPLDAERGFYARSTLSTLRNLAEFMGSIRGRRKAILMFSEGIDY